MSVFTGMEDDVVTESRGGHEEATMVLSQISKHYAGVAALTDVSIEVQPGKSMPCSGRTGRASQR